MIDDMMSVFQISFGLVALATKPVGGRAAIPCCK